MTKHYRIVILRLALRMRHPLPPLCEVHGGADIPCIRMEISIKPGRQSRSGKVLGTGIRVQKGCKYMSRRLGLKWNQALSAFATLLLVLFVVSLTSAIAQDGDHDRDRDRDDDPPSRVARLGYMEGSISFQPAGESDWVPASPNRPMTTGDKIWTDRDSRAEVQLGSATLHLGPNTGFSFLNLDDHSVQIQLSSGSLNVRAWDIDRDDTFEIDTPNQAFTLWRRGSYRIDAAEDGNSTVVTIREGEGESTGNGQSFTLHAGQRTTFSGTDSLNAEVEQIGDPDDFDSWAERREHRREESPSARYVSRQMVGYQDLDENGDWQPTPDYGPVWFPHVEAGWAPYHYGHWAWIDPWGWTWVDDAPWGYAPFHYGRWVNVYGRWGWIPGPREQRPVYAPALVVFVGGSPAAGNVAWFPLGPREVYVPSYPVSPTYVNRVNVSNTNVSTTTVTNVYNTTIINNNTTVNNTTVNNTRVNNITYVNRNVQGAVTAVPQRAFASAQPVAKAAVPVNNHVFATAPIVTRAAVSPAREAVVGPRPGLLTHVATPPQAVASRPVIAKIAPPPPPAPFAARQQLLAQHPGQPIARQEMQKLRPANAPAPVVKQAPPAKPATAQPAVYRPGAQPANARPVADPARQPAPLAQPNSRPAPQPAPNRGPEPNRGQPNQPEPPHNDRPAPAQPQNHPQPNPPAFNNNRPDANRPQARDDRPAQPENHPQPNRPDNRPDNRPNMNRPAPPQNQPAARPQNAAPSAPSHPAAAPAPQQHPQQPNDDKKKDKK